MSSANASSLAREVDSSSEPSDVSQVTSLRELASTRLDGTVWQNWPFAAGIYRTVIQVGRWLGQAGITPNSLTYSSLLLALGAGISAGTGHFFWATLWLLASGACDLLDGVVARETGQGSAWGALLDSSADRVADALPLLGVLWFFWEGGSTLSLVPAGAMLGMFLLSYIRARAESLGAKLPPLFMRRAERLVMLCVAFLLSPFSWSLEVGNSQIGLSFVTLGVGLIGVLSFVGSVFALAVARRMLTSS